MAICIRNVIIFTLRCGSGEFPVGEKTFEKKQINKVKFFN